MILAAGLGTRLRPLTNRRPKALAPVRGVPVLDYWIIRLARAGFEAVVVNAHHLAPRMMEAIHGRDWPIPVEVAVEGAILGTGGGIRNVLGFFKGESFAVVNADVVCDASFETLAERYAHSGADVGLLLHDCPEFNNVGVGEDGRILGFGRDLDALEREGRPFKKMAFTGIHFIHPRVFDGFAPGKPLDILDVYRSGMRSGHAPVALFQVGLEWREMGSVASYRALDRELAEAAPGFLDPFPGGRPQLVHPRARIEKGAELRGRVCVGAGCVVERGSVLVDTVLWENVKVGAGSLLKDCIAGDGVEVSGVFTGEVFALGGDTHA